MEGDASTEILENCQLEWDKRRGVLYVHNKDTGLTVLRICRLPVSRDYVSLAVPGQIIDVQAGPSSVPLY